MGAYNIRVHELIDSFEEFLIKQEVDVSAEAIAETWNYLADKYDWPDRLIVELVNPKLKGANDENGQ